MTRFLHFFVILSVLWLVHDVLTHAEPEGDELLTSGSRSDDGSHADEPPDGHSPADDEENVLRGRRLSRNAFSEESNDSSEASEELRNTPEPWSLRRALNHIVTVLHLGSSEADDCDLETSSSDSKEENVHGIEDEELMGDGEIHWKELSKDDFEKSQIQSTEDGHHNRAEEDVKDTTELRVENASVKEHENHTPDSEIVRELGITEVKETASTTVRKDGNEKHSEDKIGKHSGLKPNSKNENVQTKLTVPNVMEIKIRGKTEAGNTAEHVKTSHSIKYEKLVNNGKINKTAASVDTVKSHQMPSTIENKIMHNDKNIKQSHKENRIKPKESIVVEDNKSKQLRSKFASDKSQTISPTSKHNRFQNEILERNIESTAITNEVSRSQNHPGHKNKIIIKPDKRLKKILKPSEGLEGFSTNINQNKYLTMPIESISEDKLSKFHPKVTVSRPPEKNIFMAPDQNFEAQSRTINANSQGISKTTSDMKSFPGTFYSKVDGAASDISTVALKSESENKEINEKNTKSYFASKSTELRPKIKVTEQEESYDTILEYLYKHANSPFIISLKEKNNRT